LLLAVCRGGPGTARAEVRVDVDEVIFSLSAPGANEVYLVGDFNQWNPTVEPMNRVDGDRFEVGLFLVAGTYRYKFVVDGRTLADPDNAGPSPERGSPLVLVERSGGLILSTELPDENGKRQQAQFGVRYIGRLIGEDGKTDGGERIDGFVSATLDRLSARAVVATHDSTWSSDPLSIDAFFDRGRVDVSLGKLLVRGFENDSTWVSGDPFRLVGKAGVFDRDAGFRRHGGSAEARFSKAAVRGLWADATTRAPAVTAAPDFADFAAGAAADTAAYRWTRSFDGSDVGAVEASMSSGGIALGYARRDENGVNPGTFARVARDTTFTTDRYATREDRSVTTVWGGYRIADASRLVAAYGWGGATIRSSVFERTDTPLAETPPGGFATAGEAIDASFRLSDTDRAALTFETARGGVRASLGWDWTRIDFEAPVGGSRAQIDRATLDVAKDWASWTLHGRAEYTDARYGDTPGALHADWPEQNVWLSMWDAFNVARLSAADLSAYSVYTLNIENRRDRLDTRLETALVAADLAGRTRHASARVALEWRIAGPWRAGADGRFAWYDGADGVTMGYLEAGYKSRLLEANIGVGFDPVVFDPVINGYNDIGREEFLRGVLADGFDRSRASAIASGLRDRERALRDVTAIKLEIIVRLP
jgi:hypothetical protein